MDRTSIAHPDGPRDLDFLYGVIFTSDKSPYSPSKHACIFADGELDRSPTGTGVSGRAAILYSRGELDLGEALEIESIIGSRFTVKCLRETFAGDRPAVVTEVSGSAYLTGEHTFIMAEHDPLADGFLIR